MDRMHCLVDTFTATGRVTMHEPNLQNVPKDFVIEIPCKKLCSVFRCSITLLPAVLVLFLHVFLKSTFVDERHGFLKARCSTCHLTNSVKALNKNI